MGQSRFTAGTPQHELLSWFTKYAFRILSIFGLEYHVLERFVKNKAAQMPPKKKDE